MTQRWTDAEFEVVRGPSPVRWSPGRRRASGLTWVRVAYGALILLVAGYTLLLGLAGADLDTRDAVAAEAARQPVAADLRP